MEAKFKKTIFDLKIGETLKDEIKLGLRTDITRVPTGWIYQFINRTTNGIDEYVGNCFVPLKN